MNKTFITEPKIWGFVNDFLPNDHKLAWECLHCSKCSCLIHAGYNEVMSTWIETGKGNYCIKCFIIIGGQIASGEIESNYVVDFGLKG